jgi:integrase
VSIRGNRQICALKKAKNLETTQETKTCAGEKGQLIEYAWQLKKEDFKETTIKLYSVILKTLLKKGANLSDPESVKEVIANMEISTTTKRSYVMAYDTFTKVIGLKWKKPRYRPEAKYPKIPMESDIDQLIIGSGKKLGTVLLIAKETALRIGEILRLKWIDIDTERNLIILNTPEKGSNSGIYKVSSYLISRIMSLPKKSERIFPTSVNSISVRLRDTRRRLVNKLQNPRLLKITFHSLRHWKAIMLYHKLKDPYYVKDFLRHKDIRNTTLYINIERALFQSSNDDEFSVKVAKNLQEACELLKVGFEYVTEMEGVKVFRKRK